MWGANDCEFSIHTILASVLGMFHGPAPSFVVSLHTSPFFRNSGSLEVCRFDILGRPPWLCIYAPQISSSRVTGSGLRGERSGFHLCPYHHWTASLRKMLACLQSIANHLSYADDTGTLDPLSSNTVVLASFESSTSTSTPNLASGTCFVQHVHQTKRLAVTPLSRKQYHRSGILQPRQHRERRPLEVSASVMPASRCPYGATSRIPLFSACYVGIPHITEMAGGRKIQTMAEIWCLNVVNRPVHGVVPTPKAVHLSLRWD